MEHKIASESPYAPPKSSLNTIDSASVTSIKKYVVCTPYAVWPDRCFKCNQVSLNKKKVTLSHVNPWLYLAILINPLVLIILALIFQKKFTLHIPMCDVHVKKRKRFLIFQWLLALFTVLGIFVGVVTESDLALLLSILLLLIVVISAIVGRIAFVAKFKNGNLWVRGSGTEFLRSLPPFQKI